MKVLHPMLLLAATLLAPGLACSAFGGVGNSPSVSTTENATVPTTTPPLTELSPTIVPTKPIDFFTEEFSPDYEADHWQSFNLGPGELNNLVVRQEDDRLLFDLQAEDIYFYYMYTPYTYTNVSIKLKAENLGRNNNNVSLVCRMNQDASNWYEFSVTSSGLWTLYAMDNKMYHTIDGGGTNFLKQGKDVNEYQMMCDRDEITLLINGKKIETIKDTRYGFRQGFVGFNISAIKDYSVLPITVAVNSFQIDRPR